MKRSEMLKILLEAQFNPPERIQNIHDGGQQLVQMTYHLLEVIEEAGMLPPLWEGIPYELMGGMCQDPEHSWQPEDEESSLEGA